MISHVRLTSTNKNNKIIFNTARSNLDDKDKFVDTFRKQGVNMKRIHILRAGNITSPGTGPQKKARIIKGYIKKHQPSEVHMYDDDTGNLNEFLKLKQEHPDVRFYAHHVQPDGTHKPYNIES